MIVDLAYLLWTSLMLVVIVIAGRRVGGIYAALLWAQSIYFAIEFLGRPVVLLTVRPPPSRGDPVADIRLATLGYIGGMQPVLALVALGLTAYAAITAMLCWASYRAGSSTGVTWRPDSGETFALVASGWAARIVFLSSGSAVAATFADVASVAVGAGIIFGVEGWTVGRRKLYMTSMLAGSEVLWSVINASKSTIFAVGLWIIISSVLEARRPNRRVVIRLVAVAIALATLFPVIQGLKGSGASSASAATQNYPGLLRPILPIVARFDLFSATSDAYFAGPGSWISPTQAIQRGIEALPPSQLLPSKANQAGADWAIEVRAQSEKFYASGVHLADGVIAEGYILGGKTGLLVEVLFLALFTRLVAGWFGSSRRFFIFLAVAFTSQPLLFERGFLGMMEGLGKSAQVALFAWLLSIFVSQRRAVGPPVDLVAPVAKLNGAGLRNA